MAGLRPGQILAGYELGTRLGIGPVCEVWKATEAFTDEVLALKVARAHGGRAALARSATIHGHLPETAAVPIIEVNLQADPPFIARRLVREPSLARMVRQDGRLSAKHAIALLRATAARLSIAHAQGIPHLDLKAENIFWDRGETVRLTDFGCTEAAPAGPSAKHDIKALFEVWQLLRQPDAEIEALLDGPRRASDAQELLRRLDRELAERRRLAVRVKRFFQTARRRLKPKTPGDGAGRTPAARLPMHRYAWAAAATMLLATSVAIGAAAFRAARLGLVEEAEAAAQAASEARDRWPVPTQPRTPRRGHSLLRGGAQVTELTLPGDLPLADARWSHSEAEVLALTRSGILRRISIPDGLEQDRLTLPGAGRHLAVGPGQLYVATSGGVWTLEPETLQPLAFGPLRGVATITAGEAGRVYAYTPKTATLFSLNGWTGHPFARTPLRGVGPQDGTPLQADLAPDGAGAVLHFAHRSVRLDLTSSGAHERATRPQTTVEDLRAVTAYDRRSRRSLRLGSQDLDIYRSGVLQRRIPLPERAAPVRLELRRDAVWTLVLTERALYVVRLRASEEQRSSGR